MGFLESFLIIGVSNLLIAMAPGPDFLLITKESILNGKKAGLLTAFGVTCGLSIHITYCIFGLATFLMHSKAFLPILQIIGGIYIVYLGISSLLKGFNRQKDNNLTFTCNKKSDFKTMKTGFFCNVFNPKVALFFISLSTVVIDVDLPFYKLMIYGVWIMIVQFAWFGSVALLFSTPKIQKKFIKIHKYIDYFFGGVMVMLGVKVIALKL